MILDLEQVNALTPVDREHYLKLEKLFAQPGWKVVVKLAQENAASAFQNAAFATSWENNRVAMGNHVAWQQIANLERDTQMRFAEKATQAVSAREAARTSDEHSFE